MISALVMLALLQQSPEAAAPVERPVPVVEMARPDVGDSGDLLESQVFGLSGLSKLLADIG